MDESNFSLVNLLFAYLFLQIASRKQTTQDPMYGRIEPRLTQPTRNLLGRAHRRKCDQVYEAMYSAAAPAVRRPHTAAPVPVGRGSKVSEIGEEGGERGRAAGAGTTPTPEIWTESRPTSHD